MEQTLVLRRRLRPNRVLPTILHWLQNTLMFWRPVPFSYWDWTTLVLLAILLWGLYRLFTGHAGFLIGFLLVSIGGNLYNNALPIFARVRIRGDRITLGRFGTERHSLAEIQTHRMAPQTSPEHSVCVYLSEKYWPDRISFVIDKEDAITLSAYLQARGIAAVAAVGAPVALET